MVDNNKFDEFLDEVENDIRQERYEKLWKTYGKHVSTGITAILVVLAGYSLWTNHKSREHTKNSEYYLEAQQLLAAGKNDQALSSFRSISSDNTYEPLAKFSEAAILTAENNENKNIDQAIALYDELAQNTHIEDLWRSIAALESIRLQFDQNPTKAEDLFPALDPLCKEGVSIRPLALEQKAYMLQKLNKNTEAADIYAEIIQIKDAPDGVATRAQIMSEKLASKIPNA